MATEQTIVNSMDYATHRKSSNYTCDLSAILRQLGQRQLRCDQCVYRNDDITVMVYVDDLLLLGEDDKIKEFLEKLRQLYKNNNLN
eukprot:2409353-Amphidinium_carterae.1